MKKFISLALICVLCFLLIACKNTVSSSNESAEKQDETVETEVNNAYNDYINDIRCEEEKYWENIPDIDPSNLSYVYVDKNMKNTTDEPSSNTLGIAVKGIHQSIKDTSVIKIPSVINGYDVVKLLSFRVYTEDNEDTLVVNEVKELYIPDSVQEIQFDGGFSAIEKLRLPANALIGNYNNLAHMHNLKSLIIPNTTEKEIYFANKADNNPTFTALEEIYFSGSITKIQSDKIIFKKSVTLKSVAIPPSVKLICCSKIVYNDDCPTLQDVEENIFPDGITIICEKGSYAEEYAKRFNFNCQFI